MKKFKDFIKKSSNDAYVPDEPIHFKMGYNSGSSTKNDAYVPDEPIHFKMGKDDSLPNKEKNIKKTKNSLKESYHDFHKWLGTNENSEHGSSPNEISNKLVNHTKKYDLTDKQKNHIKDYTSSSQTLNKNLIKKHKTGSTISKAILAIHHKSIKALDKATNNPIGHKLHLYSGLGFNPEKHIGENGHLHLPAYTSLTHHKRLADDFSSSRGSTNNKEGHNEYHILHVETKPTDKAIHISHLSHLKDEHETILPRNTTLKVHPKPIIHQWTSHSGNNVKYHIWHAKIEHQD